MFFCSQNAASQTLLKLLKRYTVVIEDPRFNRNFDIVKGRDNVFRVAAKIVMVEQECGLNTSVEEYQAEFKFGLAEVVYQWALGTVRELHHRLCNYYLFTCLS